MTKTKYFRTDILAFARKQGEQQLAKQIHIHSSVNSSYCFSAVLKPAARASAFSPTAECVSTASIRSDCEPVDENVFLSCGCNISWPL